MVRQLGALLQVALGTAGPYAEEPATRGPSRTCGSSCQRSKSKKHERVIWTRTTGEGYLNELYRQATGDNEVQIEHRASRVARLQNASIRRATRSSRNTPESVPGTAPAERLGLRRALARGSQPLAQNQRLLHSRGGAPREWFQYGRMFQFLTEHRHLKGYSHLFFVSSLHSVTDNCGFDEPFDLIGCVLFRSEDTHPQSRVAVYVKTDAVQLQKSGIGVVERYAP